MVSYPIVDVHVRCYAAPMRAEFLTTKLQLSEKMLGLKNTSWEISQQISIEQPGVSESDNPLPNELFPTHNLLRSRNGLKTA